MKEKTLFLAWQDKRLTREWFPVGRLDISPGADSYRFRYIKGAQRAEKKQCLQRGSHGVGIMDPR